MEKTIEQHYAIKFYAKLNKSLADTGQMIKETYGDKAEALSYSHVSRWLNLFKNGRKKLLRGTCTTTALPATPLWESRSSWPSTTWQRYPSPPTVLTWLRQTSSCSRELRLPLKESILERNPLETIQSAGTKALNEVSVDAFQDAYRAWKSRWQKCVDAQGEHFEEF
ncbi:hypothetical protein ANTRET_LOCUS5241 [Anthophora retusa]